MTQKRQSDQIRDEVAERDVGSRVGLLGEGGAAEDREQTLVHQKMDDMSLAADSCMLMQGHDQEGRARGGVEGQQKQEEEKRRRDEEAFMQMWGTVVKLLEHGMSPEPANDRRPWMEEIKETLFDFSKILEGGNEEDEDTKLQHAQQHALTAGNSTSTSNTSTSNKSSSNTSTSPNPSLDISAHSFVPISQPAARIEARADCGARGNEATDLAGLVDRVDAALDDDNFGPVSELDHLIRSLSQYGPAHFDLEITYCLDCMR